MTAVDTNLLVYAHREDSPWHQAALRAMTRGSPPYVSITASGPSGRPIVISPASPH